MGTVTFEQAIEAVQAICILGFGGMKKDQIWISLCLRFLISTVLQIVLTCFLATYRLDLILCSSIYKNSD